MCTLTHIIFQMSGLRCQVSGVTCHESHVTSNSQTIRAADKILREGSPSPTCNGSCVVCHVSHVMCHMSHVTCHVLHVLFLQSVEAFWRVCYQHGQTCILFFIKIFLILIYYCGLISFASPSNSPNMMHQNLLKICKIYLVHS